MAQINFPASPSFGDTHTEAGVTWKWDNVSWNAVLAGVATTAEFLADVPGLVLATDPVWDAAGFVTLTDAPTIAVDMATFVNAKVTLGGNHQFGTPSNPKEGQSGTILGRQDGSGGRVPTFASGWEFSGGAPPVFISSAGALTVLSYQVLDTGAVFVGLAGRDVHA